MCGYRGGWNLKLHKTLREFVFDFGKVRSLFDFTRHKIHKMENFYCPVRPPALLWDLEFTPKKWNPKSWAIFACHTSLLGSTRHLSAISRIVGPFFTNFDGHFNSFCIFCGRAEIKQTPNRPIKIHQMRIKSAKIWSRSARNYTKMTYGAESWRRRCKTAQTFLDINFGSKFQVLQAHWYPDRPFE